MPRVLSQKAIEVYKDRRVAMKATKRANRLLAKDGNAKIITAQTVPEQAKLRRSPRGKFNMASSEATTQQQQTDEEGVSAPIESQENAQDGVSGPMNQLRVDDTEACPRQTYGAPKLWAKTRPALADGLPSFRIVQGGVYHSEKGTAGFAKGYLLNDDDEGTFCDEEIVITRVGGGFTKDANGILRLAKDQDLSKSPGKNLKKSMDCQEPVLVIHGSKSRKMALDLPADHKFNVLDWFIVTDIWYEDHDGHCGLKVRLEKQDLSTKSWWAEVGSPDPIPHSDRDFNLKPAVEVCGSCTVESPHIYNEGWMCLNSTCDKFWRMSDGSAPNNVSYNDSFIKKRQPPIDEAPVPLTPDFFGELEKNGTVGGIERQNWRGPACPECGRCLSREHWNGWRCDCNASWEHMVEVSPVVSKVSPGHQAYDQPLISDEIAVGSKIIGQKEVFPDNGLSYDMLTYTVPTRAAGLRPVFNRARGELLTFEETSPIQTGSIVHFCANSAVNAFPGGPNDSLANLEVLAREKLDLRRYPLSSAVVDGTLTCHFAQNFGAPYKYVVDVNSTPFSEAPDQITQFMELLTKATQVATEADGTDFRPPNELLLLGYFEEMAIGYHDDGEVGLGPTIATLSLGGPSDMYIRMKAKYYNGFSKTGVPLAVDPVPPGCLMEKERRLLRDEHIRGLISTETYRADRKLLFKGQKFKVPSWGLKMRLEHGDVVVMHGAELQKFYEHSVVPHAGYGLRFAATARLITEAH